jgi:hypothetical protein
MPYAPGGATEIKEKRRQTMYKEKDESFRLSRLFMF